MEVVLCKDVKDLGKAGEVVTVKVGYGRNYLLPQRLAVAANSGNVKRAELLKAKQAEADQKLKAVALQTAETIAKVSCTVAVEVNDNEKLYGAVTEAEIVKALESEGIKIDKKDLVLDVAIEELGIFDIGVKLHPEVVAKFRLWVTKK